MFLCNCVCPQGRSRVSQRSSSSSFFPQSGTFSPVSLCGCALCVYGCVRKAECVCLCTKKSSKRAAAPRLCVCYMTKTHISMCDGPGSDRLPVRLPVRVEQARDRDSQWKTQRACPHNSTRLYITKQLNGPVTTHCVCVGVCSVLTFTVCLHVNVPPASHNLTTVHSNTLHQQTNLFQKKSPETLFIA